MTAATSARERIGNLISESIYDNPVVTREFRTRMRGWKAFAVMGGYVLLLAGVMFIAYVVMWNRYAGQQGPNAAPMIVDHSVGMELFLWLAWTQAILLSLIIPSLTFSSITQEIERKTIEMLALTRLTPGKIVLGKQLAGFLYSLVLLICSAPLASMCLMFGGISPGEISLWYCVLVAWCWLLTCMGVFWSSLFNRTAAAALFGYGTAMVYFLITLPFGVATAAPYFGTSGTPYTLGALNPGWAAYTASMVAGVCGVKVLLAVAAVVLHVGIGTLLLLVSSTHVMHHRAERAPAIRALLVGVTVLFIWLLVGNLTTMGGGLGSTRQITDVLGITSTIVLVFVALMSCSMATGEVKKPTGQSMLAYALSPRKMLRSDLGGAISFTALWVSICYAAFGITLKWSAASTHAKIAAEVWRAYYKCGAAIIAMSIGIAAIGVLASCMVRQRRNAGAIVLLFLIVAFAGYGVMLAYYVGGQTVTSGPHWQLAAFWPMTPIIASVGDWQHMPKLWWSPKWSWLVTSVSYLLITLGVLALANGPAARGSGVREE